MRVKSVCVCVYASLKQGECYTNTVLQYCYFKACSLAWYAGKKLNEFGGKNKTTKQNKTKQWSLSLLSKIFTTHLFKSTRKQTFLVVLWREEEFKIVLKQSHFFNLLITVCFRKVSESIFRKCTDFKTLLVKQFFLIWNVLHFGLVLKSATNKNNNCPLKCQKHQCWKKILVWPFLHCTVGSKFVLSKILFSLKFLSQKNAFYCGHNKVIMSWYAKSKLRVRKI